jgi:hypothetical protein
MRALFVLSALGGAAIFGCGALLAGQSEPPGGGFADAAPDAAPGDDATIDASAPADAAGGPDTSDAQAPATGKLVFISKRTADGRMAFPPLIVSGVDSADQECQAEANDAGLHGVKFAAWLSTTETSAISRLPLGVAWRLANDNVVFSSRDAIADGPSVAIDLHADGVKAPADPKQVWTGTDATGQAHRSGGGSSGAGTGVNALQETCGDWGDGLAKGRVGDTGSVPDWTDALATLDCSTPLRILCFEL